MNTREVANAHGYRVMVAPGLWFLIDPEGRPIFWTGSGNGSPACAAVIYTAFAVASQVHELKGEDMCLWLAEDAL